MPTLGSSALTDNQRFMLVFNLTPATSVSVVDLESETFVAEITTPGCALIFPTGALRFAMLCGDGSLLTVQLDEAGGLVSRERSDRFFDPVSDPVTEKPARIGDRWMFVAFEGMMHSVNTAADGPVFETPWSIVSKDEREANWRVGGAQLMAAHESNNQLYTVMHVGPKDTHKDPGTEIWVFDASTHERLQRIVTENLVTSIQVSQDDAPLLYAAFIAIPALDIYDAVSGNYLRSIGELGSTITLLQNP